ncbi:MAG: MFS transporter [Candidatus Aminicenantes bacterium]|nr:MFS transporter [Candidatus Aminicenantes bacterium]MDH5385292.1 MFS transporter [Candidatus Aminicenantes bacterium]MDH5744341.1 MFS transporter [Candidatus Aminicenantes bacterium]
MSSACAGMFVFGIVMAILGAIMPSLFERIQFNKSEAGNLFFYMNLAMLVMSLVFGPIVDRFGFKLFLIFSSLLVVLSLFLFTSASTYIVILTAAVILGFGGGGLNGGTNALTSDIHPEKRSSALNLLGIFFGFGALTMPFLIGALLEKTGLENILILAAALSLLPFFLFLIFSFPKPKHEQGFPLSQAAHVVKNPLLWLCGFLLFFQSGNEFTVGGWISTYLHESFGLTAKTASFILAGYWASIMGGRLASSKVVKVLRNETLVLLSAMVSLIAALLIVASPSSFLASVGSIGIGLGFAAIFPTTLAVVGEAFPRLSGTAFSVVFVVALMGGMTSPWLTGKIAHAYSLKQGMFIPVFNCSMIIVLQIVILRVLRKRSIL